jgi:DNA-binding CsgD family transcriptional regulator
LERTLKVMGGEDVGREALDLERGGIAVLDSAGNVTWTDEAWSADDDGGLPRAPIGTNLLEAYRGHEDPRAQAVANGIVAVFEGKAMYFEIEHRASRESGRSYLTSVAALRGDGAGAVVVHNVVGGRAPPNLRRPVDVRSTSGAPARSGIERLTPREREVLELMAAGLDNRAIAAKLRIQYTTVRGHVRSVIEKVGARSRLEAVARAYRNGWVPP